VIGTIVSSRPSAEFDKTIGPFVQPFPLKVSVNDSILELVKQIHELVIEINDRSRYPVSDLTSNVPTFKDFPIDTYFTDPYIMLNNYPREADTQPKVEVLESLGPIIKSGLPDLSSQTLNEIAGLFLIIDYFEGEMRFNFWYHKHRFPIRDVKKWADEYFDLLDKNLKSLQKKRPR